MSASCFTLSGTVIPSAAAALRLSANCTAGTSSTGRSAGAVPCRMASTKRAARRAHRSHVDADREERPSAGGRVRGVDPFLAVRLHRQVRRGGGRNDRAREVEPQAGRQDEDAVDRPGVSAANTALISSAFDAVWMSSVTPSWFAASCNSGSRIALFAASPGSTSVSRLAQVGHDLLVDLELLDDRVARAEHPGQVAARLRQAGDEVLANRVGRVEEDDRNAVAGSAVAAWAALIEASSKATIMSTCWLTNPCATSGRLVGGEVAPDQRDPAAVVLALELVHGLRRGNQLLVADERLHHRVRTAVVPAQFAKARDERRQRRRVVVYSGVH